MSQVFVSYRHVQPDEGLADGLDGYLRERGLAVFVDKRIRVGMDWVQEIDRQLRASSFFVVLLSAHSICSDMVRQEVETAHELRRAGRMTILPVRVALKEELPYDLAAYLNRIQYVTWNPGDAEEELFERLYSAIRDDVPLPVAPVEEDASLAVLPAPDSTAPQCGPLPAADPRVVMETGTIRLDSPLYVRRREDGIAERQVGLAGGAARRVAAAPGAALR